MKKIFAFGLIGAVLYGVAADAAATRSTARTRAPAGQTTTTQSICLTTWKSIMPAV